MTELTPNEKKWLEEREKRSVPCSGQTLPPCPLSPDYRDAVEFEARVALKMAKMWLSNGDVKCPFQKCWVHSLVKPHWTKTDSRFACAQCILQTARLAVEAEYDRR